MSLGPITALIPVPRPIVLAGRVHRTRELRLWDLACLQGWLDRSVPDPMDAVRAIPPDLDEPARRKALARAYKAADAGGPMLFEPSGTIALASPEGLAVFVWVALRRWNKPFGMAEATQLALALSWDDYLRLHAVAFPVDPLAAIGRLIWGPDRSPPRGRQLTWVEAIVTLAKDWGVPLSHVYRLTFTEFVAMRRGGEQPLRGRPLRDGESPAEALREWWELFGAPGEG